MKAINMTFIELFGHTPITKILDFLGDYPRFWYTAMEIRDNTMAEHVRNPASILDSMVTTELLKKENEKYKINIDNPIIAAVLKWDFEEAKKVADKLTEEEASTKAKIKIVDDYLEQKKSNKNG